MTLLQVNNLSIGLHTHEDNFNILEDISFKVEHSQAIGIVGESGCGKSLTAAAILRLLAKPILNATSGEIFFNDQPIHQISDKKFNAEFRLKKVGIIFQESGAGLNPVLTVGTQFSEVLRRVNKPHEFGLKLLAECGLADFNRVWHSYPHQLSGGMKQRVAIAMALVGDPELLIADEPTTASDATIQLQILNLIKKLIKQRNMAVIFISHDLNVISYLCDYTYVFYSGRIVEEGNTAALFSKPAHPYTKGLVESNLQKSTKPKQHLTSIEGSVPDIKTWHKACSFNSRCAYAQTRCFNELPKLTANTHGCCACFNPVTY